MRLLSGGNQQKLIVAREIHDRAQVVVASQPTRGLDIGATEFVRDRLVEQRNAGKGVLLISADLEELAKTPVLVVCAGAKAILDLGLTLEYLETKGVTVIGYGTKELPAFYTRSSGFGVDYELDTPEEVATAFHVKQVLGQEGGLLVTNPIPEEYSMDPAVINKAIDEAVAECKAKGVHGKETTPFLLAKVKDLTGGDSLDSNIQLVYNNARVASAIACSLSKLEKQG